MSSMKIGIVMHPYGEKRPSGLGRVTAEITRALVEDNRDDNEYVVFVKGKPTQLPTFKGKCSVVECAPGWFWLDKALYGKDDLDVVFFITPFMPWFVKPKKSVVMVHDLVHFRKRRSGARAFLVRFMHRLAIGRASVVAAISPATRDDLVRLLNVPEEKIQLVRQGYTKICEIEEREVPNVKQPFFLSVGVVKERKNTLRIVEAFGLFKQQNPHDNHTLVIAGPYSSDEYFSCIQDVVKKYEIVNEVVFLDFVNDHQLSYLYKRGTALVFTTLMEGFGVPILEAMNCGLPVVTSDLPVHRQTAGPAGYFADPTDSQAIASVMRQVIVDDSERNRQIQVGREHAEQSSWERAAGEYRRIFSNITHANT